MRVVGAVDVPEPPAELSAQNLVTRQDRAQVERVGGHGQQRHVPVAGMGECPGRILDRRSARACVRSLIHEAHQASEGVRLDDGVGVQHDEVAPGPHRHRAVVRTAEPEVLTGLDERDLWKHLPHHGDRTIRRAVVHDDDLERQALARLADRLQTVGELGPRVEVDDRDRSVHQSSALDTRAP